MEILMYIFYFFTIPALMWEVTAFQKTTMFVKIIKNKEHKDFKALIILMFCYFVWTFIGLFSSQWIYFLILMILSFIPKKSKKLKQIDAIISFGILLAIIITKFH